jgi:hypothetical protein
MGWQFATLGAGIPFPHKDILFVEQDVYRYQCLFEQSILAYYVGQKNIGLRLSNQLLLTQRGTVPTSTLNRIRQNLEFYLVSLPGTTTQTILLHDEPGWSGTYPSMLWDGTQMILNLRLVNYTVTDQSLYSGETISDLFPTRNVRATRDGTNGKWYTEHVMEERYLPVGDVVGYEDVRLFWFQQKISFLATDIKETQRCMCLGNSMVLLKGVAGRPEKNWLPFESQDGELLVLYAPFEIRKIDPVTGETTLYTQQELPFDCSGFHGWAGPVVVNDGYLFIVQEVFEMSTTSRTSFHRVVFMNIQLKMTHISKPFTMRGESCIEFVSSMLRIEDVVYLSWCVDRTAYITQIPLDVLESFCTEEGSFCGE